MCNFTAGGLLKDGEGDGDGRHAGQDIDGNCISVGGATDGESSRFRWSLYKLAAISSLWAKYGGHQR